MREIPRPEFETPETEEAWDAATATADWKAPPHEVLDQVDGLLAAHGLEIVMIDELSDSYEWRIERRQA